MDLVMYDGLMDAVLAQLEQAYGVVIQHRHTRWEHKCDHFCRIKKMWKHAFLCIYFMVPEVTV